MLEFRIQSSFKSVNGRKIEKIAWAIRRELQVDSFIIRSSSRRRMERVFQRRTFLSLANISTINLEESILKVIDAYGEPDPCDEVLVQPMLENVVRSGVAFSHDPNTCSLSRH